MSDGSPSGRVAPLRPLLPAIGAASVYAVAAVVWATLGRALPGGRWLAVHLFTLGVLSNVVVALTHHFAQTLLHAPDRTVSVSRMSLLNSGVALLVAGLPLGYLPAFVTGAAALVAAVLWLYLDLRRLRKALPGGRFGFVVRTYERATGAFVHGALLGILLGTGLLGSWHAAGRIAHAHVNGLGWGGLTLLATLVFFGPTILRTRMEPDADVAGARALRFGATALTVAALALLAMGAGGRWLVPARLLAAAALAVYAWATTVVCSAVVRAGRRGRDSAPALLLRASCVWFVVTVWADAVTVASGRMRLLDALGVALVVGTLGQAILAAAAYLVPLMAASGPSARSAAWSRLDLLARTRTIAFNVGAALAVMAAAAGSAAGTAGAVLARSGWTLILGTVLAHLGLLAAAPRLARSA